MATSYSGRLGFAPEEAVKAPCVVASLVNITLSGEQTINSVPVVAGNRVLITSQTDPTENGVYNVATGAWSRATDWNDRQDVVNGQLILANIDLYRAEFIGDFVVGSTPVEFYLALPPLGLIDYGLVTEEITDSNDYGSI